MHTVPINNNKFHYKLVLKISLLRTEDISI
jgi:hypothetical protein